MNNTEATFIGFIIGYVFSMMTREDLVYQITSPASISVIFTVQYKALWRFYTQVLQGVTCTLFFYVYDITVA
jgi:hypothetical protein